MSSVNQPTVTNHSHFHRCLASTCWAHQVPIPSPEPKLHMTASPTWHWLGVCGRKGPMQAHVDNKLHVRSSSIVSIKGCTLYTKQVSDHYMPIRTTTLGWGRLNAKSGYQGKSTSHHTGQRAKDTLRYIESNAMESCRYQWHKVNLTSLL